MYGNIWALSRDKNVYRSPEKFIPDRFVDEPNLPDPRDFAFGFGRRSVHVFPTTDRVLLRSTCTLLTMVVVS